jgi:hypothetical protein
MNAAANFVDNPVENQPEDLEDLAPFVVDFGDDEDDGPEPARQRVPETNREETHQEQRIKTW